MKCADLNRYRVECIVVLVFDKKEVIGGALNSLDDCNVVMIRE